MENHKVGLAGAPDPSAKTLAPRLEGVSVSLGGGFLQTWVPHPVLGFLTQGARGGERVAF